MSNRPFNLEEAKAGHPLITRDGRPAKFIAHVPECDPCHRVVAHIEGAPGIGSFCEDGQVYAQRKCPEDLVMLQRKVVKWIPIIRKRDGSTDTMREGMGHRARGARLPKKCRRCIYGRPRGVGRMKRRPKARLLDPSFRYTNSEDSMKPGYLAAKFAALIRAQRRPDPPANVVVIAKKKG